MNEQEAEEQGTFLKGALGALANLASDIEKQRLQAYLLENHLVCLKAEAYKIREEIEKYFGLEEFDTLTKEEQDEIKRGN